MALELNPLRPGFAAEATGITLRDVHDEETLAAIRAGMDAHAVLVFRDQSFSDDEQLDFARRFDGTLHARTGSRVLGGNRFGNEALTDISNVGESGDLRAREDRKRLYSLANRLWHTDASFEDPRGRYSMLHARVVPAISADTEYADMRAAYDALDDALKATLAGLTAHHSIAYSRESLGFEFSAAERRILEGAVHPVVHAIPGSGRRALYLASHASRFMEWPVPEGRLLIRELVEHATQPAFVYRHVWREGDLVIWDNRATMHRAKRFDDTTHRREMRRVTTLDVGPRAAVPVPAAA